MRKASRVLGIVAGSVCLFVAAMLAFAMVVMTSPVGLLFLR